MLHVKDQVLCEYLWILKHLGKVEHAAAGATRFIDYSNPVGHCLGPGLLVDEFSQARMSETEQELLEERDGVRDLL